MTNIANYPLEDNFKTSLTQAWDGSTGNINVAATPNFTFPSGITTYIVANPGKTNMQIATINAYNGTNKTITVSNITLEKGASVNSTAQSHAVGSEVIISDNFQFWQDIVTAVNSKAGEGENNTFTGDNTFTGSETINDITLSGDTITAGLTVKSLTTTQRDALTPAEGMIIKNSTTGVLNQYIGGSWTTFASGVTPNASETVAGKVEVATTAEYGASTDTGGTGAILVVKPSDIQDSLPVSATTTTEGKVERATDAEALASTDTTRYVTPSQISKYISSATVDKASNVAGSGTGVTLSAIPATARICVVRICSDNTTNNISLDGSGVIYLDGSGIIEVLAKQYGTFDYFGRVYKSGSNILIDWDIGTDTSPVDTLTFDIDFRN